MDEGDYWQTGLVEGWRGGWVSGVGCRVSGVRCQVLVFRDASRFQPPVILGAATDSRPITPDTRHLTPAT